MARADRRVAVLTGDIIASSQYAPAERRRLDRKLRAAFAQVGDVYADALDAPLGFRITAGDEFQCVLTRVDAAFDLLTLLRALCATSGVRPTARFRAALGVGTMTVRRRANSYEADGPAFVHARRALDEAKAARSPLCLTRLSTGDPAVDAPVNVVLTLLDGLADGWTVPQWQAVRWAMAGLDRVSTGRKLRITHQNVSKRLLAADWARFDLGRGLVARWLAGLAAHPQKGARAICTL